MDNKGYFFIIKDLALKNPKGTIKTFGNWNGSSLSGFIDIVYDIQRSLACLNNIPRVIMMSPQTYSDFVSHISFDTLYQIGAIFGCAPHDRSWLEVRDGYDNDCALIIARHQDPYGTSGPDPTVVLIDIR